MKKAVKALAITAAVAAVAGIGAVSFAQWSASATQPVSKSGTTGHITTVGAITVVADEASGGDTLKGLVPADQGLVSGYVNYWKFTISAPAATGEAPTFTILGSITKGTGTEVGQAKLYWLNKAPDSSTPETDHEITGSATNLTGVASGGDVYVYLVASNTDAMDATVSLTFSVAA